MKSAFRKCAIPSFRKSVLPVLLLSATMLAGCATPQKPPEITYDRDVPALPAVPVAVTDDRPRPIHTLRAGHRQRRHGRHHADGPRRERQRRSAGAAAPGGLLQRHPGLPMVRRRPLSGLCRARTDHQHRAGAGESLTDAGPIAAGDTARWIIGDTESGSGPTRRVHILVKPSRVDISTNLVVTTDRRVYMIELRSGAKPYMPSVAWAYPQPRGGQGRPFRQRRSFQPSLPATTATA